MSAILANIYFEYQNRSRSVRDEVKINISVYTSYDENEGEIFLNVEYDEADNLMNSGNVFETGININSYDNIDDIINDSIKIISSGKSPYALYKNGFSLDETEKCYSDIKQFKSQDTINESNNIKSESSKSFDNSNSYKKNSSSNKSKSTVSVMYGSTKDSYNENKVLKDKQRAQAKEIYNKGSSTSIVVLKILTLATVGVLKGFWIFLKMILKISFFFYEVKRKILQKK